MSTVENLKRALRDTEMSTLENLKLALRGSESEDVMVRLAGAMHMLLADGALLSRVPPMKLTLPVALSGAFDDYLDGQRPNA